jgi:hypothetical protein
MMKYRFFGISCFRYFSVIFAGLVLLYCAGVDTDSDAMELAKLIPDDFDGWKAVDEIQNYNRQTIFDYIDGAGEVYLLYDFKDVAVKILLGPDSTEITIEIFDMGSSEDAFGIFSHSREGNDIGIGGGSEFRDGFLCFWKGKYFVCIYSSKQAADFNDTIIAISKTIEGKITGQSKEPDILGILPDDGLTELSPIYFHKQTSLNYHYFLAEENILNLNNDTEAVIANYRPGRTTLLCIKYADANAALAAYDNFILKYIPEAESSGIAEIEKGRWIKAMNTDRFFVAVFDAPDKDNAVSLANNVKENISRMEDG